MRIHWEEAILEDIIKWYIETFDQSKAEIFNTEHYIDIAKGKVIFKMLVEDKPDDAEVL